MIQIRISRPEDVTRQRELWRLAFGDEGAYVDNFYRTYYRPERMLLLEEDGEVQAMTAWFDTTFVVPERGRYRAAYLYAVATHPEARGRGLAGQLLAGADRIFREWDIPAVTTVPAEPSLHRFFGRNGFRECFVDGQFSLPRNGRPRSWRGRPWSACLRGSTGTCGRSCWPGRPISTCRGRPWPIRRGPARWLPAAACMRYRRPTGGRPSARRGWRAASCW